MKKKIISLIMSGLLLSLSMISCSDNSDDIQNESKSDENPSVGTVAEEEKAEALENFDAIDSKDYGGITVRIADHRFSPDAIYFGPVLLDDYYSDAFYDSVYDRQLAVADKMNIKFEPVYGWTETGVKNSIVAGAGDFDLYFPMIDKIFSCVQQGLAIDLNTMKVDTSKPYWNQNSVEDFTFGGKLYFGMPAINFDQYESMAALFYNGQILENNGVDSSLYDLFMEGEWTIDKMSELMELCISDTSGDGLITRDGDIYGLIGFEFAYMPSLYASGYRTFDLDEDKEELHITFTDEKVMAAGTALKNIYFRDTGVDFGSETEDDRIMFKSGNVLFYSRQIGDFKNLRDKEDDYGIICYPSVDGRTDGACYVSLPYCMMVPSDIKNQDCVATAIELLAAYTQDVVLDNYINRAVVGKGTRDIQSAEIVRDMFTRRAFDVGEALSLTTLQGAWATAIRKDTYSSIKATAEKSFTKAFMDSVAVIAGD